MQIQDGFLDIATRIDSPNQDGRPDGEISLVVVHGISLPRGHFGGRYIEDLFCNRFDRLDAADLGTLDGVRVSSHLLIRRDGAVIQFVPFSARAWHAGESVFRGRPRCNDYSAGIELEGTDDAPYTDSQYKMLAAVCNVLLETYDIDRDAISGHEHIAPGRKTDPGPAFDWTRLNAMLDRLR